jgi:mannose/fructose/N-acetylgalactosamine-specific phosphotransferase system component IIC
MLPDLSFAAGFTGLVLLGAVLNLDRHGLGPFMLGRPLVVGLVLGAAAEQIGLGVWLGLSAELLWLAALPLGGQITPNAGLAASAAFIAWEKGGWAASSVLKTAGGTAEAALVVAFLTIPVWAKAMGFVNLAGRRLVPPVLARVRADLDEGREPRFFQRNLYGLAVSLILSVAFLALTALINIQIIKAVMSFAPQAALLILDSIFKFLPFAGLLGMAVFLESRVFPFYLGGLLASLLALSTV